MARFRAKKNFRVDRVLMTSSAGLAIELNLVFNELLKHLKEAKRVKAGNIESKDFICEMEKIERYVSLAADILKESKRQDCLRVEKISMSEIVDSVLELFSDSIAQNGFVIEHLKLEQEPKLILNTTRIREALMNLITNAIEANIKPAETESELNFDDSSVQAMVGSNTGEAPKIRISYEVIDDTLKFSLQDWGPGIAEELSAQIFEPLSTRGLAKHNTGLGLAIARQMIEDHGGNIYLRSCRNPTHFEIVLPLHVKTATVESEWTNDL